MLRVLVCDDEPLIRSGLATTLADEPGIEVVGEAADGAQAIRLARRLEPDVVVMDIRMPVLDGIEATRQLVGAFGGRTGPRVLILTMFHDDEYVSHALLAGASGFVLKDVPPHELGQAIKVVAEGEAMLDPAVTRRLLERFIYGRAAAPPPGLAQLTDRERETLVLLGHGASNPEIATALRVSRETVKTHVSHVLMKLDLRDRVHAVVYAHRHRLVRRPD
jgi:DNA-binding NarL/FixJ family response regulator